MSNDQELRTIVITTNNVLMGKFISSVYHDVDGDFQVFSECDGDANEETAAVISISELFDLDDSLIKVLLDLPKGFEAHRESKSSKWKFVKSK